MTDFSFFLLALTSVENNWKTDLIIKLMSFSWHWRTQTAMNIDQNNKTILCTVGDHSLGFLNLIYMKTKKKVSMIFFLLFLLANNRCMRMWTGKKNSIFGTNITKDNVQAHNLAHKKKVCNFAVRIDSMWTPNGKGLLIIVKVLKNDPFKSNKTRLIFNSIGS